MAMEPYNFSSIRKIRDEEAENLENELYNDEILYLKKCKQELEAENQVLKEQLYYFTNNLERIKQRKIQEDIDERIKAEEKRKRTIKRIERRHKLFDY